MSSEHRRLAGVVRVEVHDHQHRVAVVAVVVGDGLRVADDRVAVGVVEAQVAQPLQGGVLAAELVEPGEVAARGCGPRPRPPAQSRGRSWYFSESRYSSLPGRSGDVLAQLVAGVDAPGGGEGRGQHGADLERRRAAVLQVRVQDVGGVDEEVGPHEVRRSRSDSSVRYSSSSPFVVAPGEVRVGLVEADLRPGSCIIAGRVNASARKSTSGSVVRISRDQPLPEDHRLGVRVVDAEDPHAVVHPVPQDAQHLGVRGRRGRVSKLIG